MKFKKSIFCLIIIFILAIGYLLLDNLVVNTKVTNNLTIYVDDSFTDIQYNEIYWGIKEWEFASSEDIKFNIIKKKLYFWERFISNIDQRIIIYNATKDAWQRKLLIHIIDVVGNRAIAYTLTKSLDVYFIKDFMIGVTTTHEIGHVLLKGSEWHSNNPFSVMFPEIGGNVQYITLEDMEKVRKELDIEKD